MTGLNQTWHQEYTLQPAETKAILIRELIRSKEKDLRGQTLPAAAQAGDISWFTFALGKGTGRLLVSNPQTALARNFSCGNYIVMCSSSLAVSTATFAVGGTGSLGPIEANTCTAYAPSACSGNSYGSGGGASYYWTSLNTSIATISGSNTNPSGTFLGQSPGTGTGQGEISNGTGCSFVSDGTLNVLGPDHVMVRSDVSGVGTCTPHCYGPVYRNISFQVVFVNNTNDNGTVPIVETLSNISSNTCNTGTPVAEPCGNASYGQFIDTYDTNYTSNTSPIPHCGYTENQTYQWCPAAGNVTIAHLPNNGIYSDYITVNGVTTPSGMAAGTMIH